MFVILHFIKFVRDIIGKEDEFLFLVFFGLRRDERQKEESD